ncbi:MAG: cell division protein FtsL [Rhodobacteraceae bacterium]|nr:cell division protein FtsL [Paracoccaceae bacterium]
MRGALYLSAAVLVAVCATWAYRVNYATQEALNRLADLRAEIAMEREALSVLNAEWAYLNRPDRLAALVAGPGAGLGLVPLTPEQFGEGAMVAYPEPEAPASAGEDVPDGATATAAPPGAARVTAGENE